MRNADANNYWGDAWYDVALVMTNGNRTKQGGSPYDWNYNSVHVNSTARNYDIDQSWRYFRHYLTALQTYNTEIDAKWIEMEWVNHHHSHSVQKLAVNETFASTFSSMENTAEFWRVTQQMMRGWAKVGLRYQRSEYPTGTGQNDWMDASYTPQRRSNIGWGLEADKRADEFYTLAHLAAESPAPNAKALDTYARWGEMMWPNGDWEQWFLDSSSQNIPMRAGWNLVSSRLSPNDSDIESVFSNVSSDISLVKNGQGEVYSPALDLNEIGYWDVNEGYMVYMATDRSFEINGAALDETRQVSLKEGWNLLPYYPSTEMPVEDAFASIESKVVIVKDEDGNSYVPDPDLTVNEIGNLQPGRAYKVYLSEATSFSYPAP